MPRNPPSITDQRRQLPITKKPEGDSGDNTLRSARLERFLAELAVRAVLDQTRRKENGDGDSTTVRS